MLVRRFFGVNRWPENVPLTPGERLASLRGKEGGRKRCVRRDEAVDREKVGFARTPSAGDSGESVANLMVKQRGGA